MCSYPTALLAGLSLAFLTSHLQSAQAINVPGGQAIDQPASLVTNHTTAAKQLVDSSVEPFHRGSGRFQLFWESTVATS